MSVAAPSTIDLLEQDKAEKVLSAFTDLTAANKNSPPLTLLPNLGFGDLAFQKSNDDANSPMVRAAAEQIIKQYKQNVGPSKPFLIEAFDIPHIALAQISEQLDGIGLSFKLKGRILESLKNYVLRNGGNFARATGAKPVRLALMVDDKKPEFKFKESVTELAAIDAHSAIVEGAANVNLRITVTGTAMTSNAANVDKIFSNVRGDKLWIMFEAPTKEDLEGMMNERQMALTGLGEVLGGGVSGSDLKALIARLEKSGQMTPQILELIKNLVELKNTNGKLLSPEEKLRIQMLVERVTDQVAQALASGEWPAALMKGTIEALTSIVKDNKFESFVNINEIGVMKIRVDAFDMSEKLKILTVLSQGGISDELIQTLKDIEIQLKSNNINDIKAASENLLLVIKDMGTQALQNPLLMGISVNAASLISTMDVMATTIPSQTMDSASAIAELLQAMDKNEQIPEPIQAILDNLKKDGLLIENIDPKIIALALMGKGDVEFHQNIAEILVLLKTPETSQLLSQDMLNAVNVVLKDNSATIDSALSIVALNQINQVLQGSDLSVEQRASLTQMVETITAEGSLKSVDATALAKVVDLLPPDAQANFLQTLSVVAAAQSAPVVLAQETINKIGDLTTQLEIVQKSLEGSPNLDEKAQALAAKITETIDALKNNPSDVATLAQVSLLISQINENGGNPLQGPPSEINAELISLADTQRTAISLNLGVSEDVVKSIEHLVAQIPALKDSGISPTLLDALTKNPTSAEAIAALQDIQTQLAKNGGMTPDTAVAFNLIAGTQISYVMEKTGLNFEQARDFTNILAQGLNPQTETGKAFAALGLDKKDIIHVLEKNPELAKEITKVAELLRGLDATDPASKSLIDLIQKNPDILNNPVFKRDVTQGSPDTNGKITPAILLASATLTAYGNTPVTLNPNAFQSVPSSVVNPATLDPKVWAELKVVDNALKNLANPKSGKPPTVNDAVVATQHINNALANKNLPPQERARLALLKIETEKLIPQHIKDQIKPELKRGHCGDGPCLCDKFGKPSLPIGVTIEKDRSLKIKNSAGEVTQYSEGYVRRDSNDHAKAVDSLIRDGLLKNKAQKSVEETAVYRALARGGNGIGLDLPMPLTTTNIVTDSKSAINALDDLFGEDPKKNPPPPPPEPPPPPPPPEDPTLKDKFKKCCDAGCGPGGACTKLGTGETMTKIGAELGASDADALSGQSMDDLLGGYDNNQPAPAPNL